jgi:hypothetical protein
MAIFSKPSRIEGTRPVKIGLFYVRIQGEYCLWMIRWFGYIAGISFLAAVGQGGRSADLIHLVLLPVVRLIFSEHHSGFACSFGVVVPDGLGLSRVLLAGFHFFLPQLAALGIPEDDAALVVVAVEACVNGKVPLESLARLKTGLSLPCQPKDHWDCVPMGLETFLGLGTSMELFPAGVSSIILL